MGRIEKFRSYAAHPWLGKTFAKLKVEDIVAAEAFMAAHAASSRDAFELAVNRMYLDKHKPKNWTIVTELLSSCNAD